MSIDVGTRQYEIRKMAETDPSRAKEMQWQLDRDMEKEFRDALDSPSVTPQGIVLWLIAVIIAYYYGFHGSLSLSNNNINQAMVFWPLAIAGVFTSKLIKVGIVAWCILYFIIVFALPWLFHTFPPKPVH